MAILKNTEINDVGFLQLPAGTTNQRPSSPANGSFRFNTDIGNIEVYENGKWSSFLGEPGTVPYTAFDSISEIENLGLTGLNTLYTTFGNSTAPTPVVVDFDSAGGPYILISFRFDGGALDAFNDTLVGNHDGSNDYTLGRSNQRLTRSNNLQLGVGNVQGTRNFHPTEVVPRAGGGLTGNNNNDITEQTVSYFNHATGSLIDVPQENALRAWAKELSQDTPHAGVIVDSDGGTQGLTQPWDVNSYFAPDTGGHAAWIEEPSGDKALLTPATHNSDEHHSVQLWTHNSYRHFPSSNNTAGTPAGSNEGLADLNSALLIPSRVRIYTYTGGGAFVATPYSPNARNGQGNFLSNRTFFLVRD